MWNTGTSTAPHSSGRGAIYKSQMSSLLEKKKKTKTSRDEAVITLGA